MSQIFPILACLLLTLLAGPAHATTENYQRGVTALCSRSNAVEPAK